MQRVPAERWALGYPHFERKMRWREYVSNPRNVRNKVMIIDKETDEVIILRAGNTGLTIP